MTTESWGAIYKEMGAKPVINATGSVTLLGGSTPVAEVKAAMDAADSAFIPLIELEQVAGDRIAEMLGVPAAYITSGAGSALTLMTAAFMAGIDDDKIQQLPDTMGMPTVTSTADSTVRRSTISSANSVTTRRVVSTMRSHAMVPHI